MKKNILYAIFFALLLAASIYIVYYNKQNTVASDRDFATENTDDIYKIFLADKPGSKSTLEREGDHWMVNGKYKVMPEKIDMLLSTLRNIKVNYPVPQSRLENVIKELATSSTKVELYEKGDKSPFKTYFVGGATLDDDGTYMIMQVNGKTADRPYVLYLPGERTALGPRYLVKELDWRDPTVFDYPMKSIKKVKVDYKEKPENSYQITVVSADSFTVEPLGQTAGAGVRKLYKPGIVKYLSSFEDVNAESFENELAIKDSIINGGPFLELSVEDVSGAVNSIKVFYMPVNKRTKMQFDQYGTPVDIDIDKYYALINEGKDFVVIQDFVFGKIFRRYEDFLVSGNSN